MSKKSLLSIPQHGQRLSIAGAIRTTLTKQLTLVGHVMDDWLFEDIQHLTDPSDLVAHSIVRFTYWTTATA